MKNKCITILFLFFISLIFSCQTGDEQKYSKVYIKLQSGCGEPVVVVITNPSYDTVAIYKPREAMWFFWSAEIKKNVEIRRYIIRTDIPWYEPPVIFIPPKNSYYDTLFWYFNTFYDVDCLDDNIGCSPLDNADEFRLIYEFKGLKFPEDNLTGVFVPENIPIKEKTIVGKFVTNWIKLQCNKDSVNNANKYERERKCCKKEILELHDIESAKLAAEKFVKSVLVDNRFDIAYKRLSESFRNNVGLDRYIARIKEEHHNKFPSTIYAIAYDFSYVDQNVDIYFIGNYNHEKFYYCCCLSGDAEHDYRAFIVTQVDKVPERAFEINEIIEKS